MNTRLIYVLYALFFGGLLALWGSSYFGALTERELQRRAGLVLPGLADVKAAEVRRVELTGGGKPAVAFERREDASWQMDEPVNVLADRNRIEALIASLKGLRRSPDAGIIKGPDESFGLVQPRTVRLFGPDRSTLMATLEVGTAHVLKEFRYVRPAGGSIEVVDPLPLASVDLPPAAWRQRSLFTVSTLDITRLRIGGPGRSLEAERDGGRWRLLAPIQAPGDLSKVDGVLADLAALRVEDGDTGFVEDGVRDLAKFGLDRPRITIELSTGPSATRTTQNVQVGKVVEGRPDRAYARRADQDDVVLVNPKALEALGTQPHALRSQKVADFDKTRVETISVRIGDVEHELASTPSGWAAFLREGKGLKPLGQADLQLTRALLDKLDALETSDFLDPKSRPDACLDHPSVVVKVWQVPEGPPRTPGTPPPPRGEPVVDLALGRRDAVARTVYARSGGDPTTLLAVPENLLEVFPPGSFAYLDRSILVQDRAQFDRLTIRRDGQDFILQAPATPRPGPDAFTGWRMTAPVDAPADSESVARLAILLSALRAESFVAEAGKDLKSYGLDAPGLVVSWTTRTAPDRPGPGPGRTLSVGHEVPDGQGSRYARVSGDPWVFTLKAPAVAILGAELHDRRVLEFPIKQVRGLQVRWPGRSIALERDAASPDSLPAWRPSPGVDLSGFELARVNTLLETLARLRAARFVQYDGPFPALAGLSDAAFSVRVLLEGESTARELRVGAPGPRLGTDPTRQATASTGAAGPVVLLVGPLWDIWAEPPNGSPGDLPADVFTPNP